MTDGPFAEAKEWTGGFAIISVKSKEEAIERTKRCLTEVCVGESHIRQLHDVPAFAANQAGR